MKSIFQSIAFRGPWARVLIRAGGCVALVALVLVWSPWRTKELSTVPPGQPATVEAPKQKAADVAERTKEPLAVPPGQPATVEGPKQETADATDRTKEPWTVPSGEPATLQALKQEAAEVAERTVKAFPRDPDSHALKGNACLFSGKAAEAVRSWQRCLELDPNRAGAYDGISLVAWHGGQFEEAVAACRQALKYKTNMPDVHFRLGRALIELGRVEESIAVAQGAVRLWPRAVDAHLILGQGYMQSQEYAKAQECFLRAIEIRPDHTQAYYGLATASAKLGQRDKARQCQERFRALMDAEKADFTELTRNQSDLSEWSDQRARTAAIYAGAAGIYRNHGNVQQAKRLLQRAAIIDPNIMKRR